jgi:hypothetical protein
VADVAPGVDADPALETAPEVAEAAAAPREAARERGGRHALDARQHLREPAAVVGLRRGEREAAVAVRTVVTPCQDAGDAVGSQSSCAS